MLLVDPDARDREWGLGYPRFACSLLTPGYALRAHHISAQRYRELLLQQDGVCGICRECNVRVGEVVPLVIDHDHVCCNQDARSCGRCIRGLLCASCNGLVAFVERGRLRGLESLGRRWLVRARAYLLAAGCDPADPDRRAFWREQAARFAAVAAAAGPLPVRGSGPARTSGEGA